MKHNFILRKDNLELFKQRFEKLLTKTGCLETYGIYKGARKIASVTKGFKFPTITRTCVNYILKEKVQYDIYGKNKGLIIRLHSDGCIPIFYGQKIKFTPNRIYLIGEAKQMVFYKKYGTTSVIYPSLRLEKAREEIYFAERTADDYWRSYEHEELEKMQKESYL